VAIRGAEQIARGREIALLAHPHNDRHEDKNHRRLIDVEPTKCVEQPPVIRSGSTSVVASDGRADED